MTTSATPPSATLTPEQVAANYGSLIDSAFTPFIDESTYRANLARAASGTPNTPSVPTAVPTADPNAPDFNFRNATTNENYLGEWTRLLRNTTGMTGRSNPLIITTDEWISQGRYIVFWAGPESVQWNIGLRGTTQETRGGLIQHYWKDAKRNTFMNEPEMAITFQTGNIMPVRVTQDLEFTNLTDRLDPSASASNRIANTLVQIPYGLMNLYDFLELLNSKRTMADGTTNYVHMMYSSLLFPKIILRGFFSPEAGMSFQEAAMENAEIKWATSFRVTRSYPNFTSAYSLAQTWNNFQAGLGYNVNTATGVEAVERQGVDSGTIAAQTRSAI